jgi:hypothetical protein
VEFSMPICRQCWEALKTDKRKELEIKKYAKTFFNIYAKKSADK